MCLGIPMKIVNINGSIAHCIAKGIERKVNVFMLQDDNLDIGDYVMVHTGHALQKMSESEALATWELLEQILENESQQSGYK